jgi:GNAT superfamily N-acetyltransferase
MGIAAASPPTWLTPTDAPAPSTFDALFNALDACSLPLIGPARPRLLVIPVHDDAGAVAGGLWASTQFRWLHIELLFVPEPLRHRGLGSALMAAAELEARKRDCIGAYLDAFSFQAAAFYRKRGFTEFGMLPNFPPGHQRFYLHKMFGTAGRTA